MIVGAVISPAKSRQRDCLGNESIMRSPICIAGILLLILAQSPVMDAGEPASDRKPNIIYIMLDDAGYGDLNTDPEAIVKTPSFARMAREGILFNHHR